MFQQAPQQPPSSTPFPGFGQQQQLHHQLQPLPSGKKLPWGQPSPADTHTAPPQVSRSQPYMLSYAVLFGLREHETNARTHARTDAFHKHRPPSQGEH